MIKTMFMKNKLLFIVTVFLSFIYSFNGVLISSIVNYVGNFNDRTTYKTIFIFGIIAVSGWFIVYLSNYICNVLQAKIIRNTNLYYKVKLIKSYWYEQRAIDNSSKIISTLMNDFKLIEDSYFKEAFNVFNSTLTLLVSLVYMLTLNKLVSIIFLFFSLIPLVVPVFFSKLLNLATQEWTNQNKVLIDQLKDFFKGLGTFETYGRKKAIFNLIKTNVSSTEKSQFNLSVKQSKAQFMGSVMAGIAFIVPFVLGCFLMISSNTLSTATLLAIFLANDRVVSPIMNITTSVNEMISTKNIRLKIKKHIKKNKLSKEVHNIPSHQALDFKIKNIEYVMKNSGRILKCNFDIKNNDKILIIGESGTGKSTLLKIIDGSIIPTKGKIVEVTDKKHILSPFFDIAYVNQTPYIFSSSILDNITLFDKNADWQKVKNILAEVGLDSFSKKELQHLELEKNGMSVSGGQKQKIELARALFSDKKLILADEITANLDKKNAEKIRELLFEIPHPVVEVSHHFDMNDDRYTKVFKLNTNSELEGIR